MPRRNHTGTIAMYGSATSMENGNWLSRYSIRLPLPDAQNDHVIQLPLTPLEILQGNNKIYRPWQQIRMRRQLIRCQPQNLHNLFLTWC